jgi:hypothetical protein
MWKVGRVGPVRTPAVDGHGFNIISEGDKPLVLFAYATRVEAIAASIQIGSAIQNAIDVRPHGQ